MAADVTNVIRRSEVDGVPVFFVEAEGPTMAGLIFRVGQADETVPTRGITHLVEHLAMHSIGSVPYQHNGTVDLTDTTFVARGTAEEVGAFLRTVCASLGNLPVDRSALEAQILRAEASGRTIGVPVLMAFLRFGFISHGLPWLPEFFLNDPRPGPMLEWSASRFSRANCALWVVGTMPPDLALPLPAGNRQPFPEARQIGNLSLPAFLQSGNDALAIDYLSPRTAISTTLVRIILKRVHEQIRQAKGLTYLVAGYRQSLSTVSAENAIWLNCLEKDAAQVRTHLLDILGELAAKGPTQQELEEDTAGYVRSCADPESRVRDAVGAATYEVTGMEPLTVQNLLDEQRAVTAAACAAEFTQSLTTGILVAPASSGSPPQGMTAYPVTCTPVTGTTLKPQGARPWQKTDTLVAGPEGVSKVNPSGQAATVRWPDCVALVVDGDGSWRLLGADGFSVEFRPGEWSNSGLLTRLVEEKVPPELRVGPPV